VTSSRPTRWTSSSGYQDEIDSLEEYQRISYEVPGYTFRFETL
jgi:hypothetical protein